MIYIPTGKELIDPFKVLVAAGIQPGMSMADFGCGTLGHYVFVAARLVGPEGRVYAIDILTSVLESITGRMKMENVTNVVPLRGDIEREHGVNIPDNSVNIGLLSNNLFMSKQQAVMIQECARTIKPGGKFIVIDWKPTGSPFGPEFSSRVKPEDARRLVEGVGLKFEKEIVPGEYHYGFVFTK